MTHQKTYIKTMNSNVEYIFQKWYRMPNEMELHQEKKDKKLRTFFVLSEVYMVCLQLMRSIYG